MFIETIVVSVLLTIVITFILTIFFKYLSPWFLRKLVSPLLRFKYRSFSKELREKSYKTFLNDCDIARLEGVEKETIFIIGFIFSSQDNMKIKNMKRK